MLKPCRTVQAYIFQRTLPRCLGAMVAVPAALAGRQWRTDVVRRIAVRQMFLAGCFGALPGRIGRGFAVYAPEHVAGKKKK